MLIKYCLQAKFYSSLYFRNGFFSSSIIYDPEMISQNNGKIPDGLEPVVTFDFPRQKSGRRLCIADFFAPKESGITDVFPMQAVTVGEVATEYAKKLFDGNEYTILTITV